jgi:hypothetical protein
MLALTAPSASLVSLQVAKATSTKVRYQCEQHKHSGAMEGMDISTSSTSGQRTTTQLHSKGFAGLGMYELTSPRALSVPTVKQ